MKISPYDKLQGYIHSKKYRTDYLKYSEKRDELGEIDFVLGNADVLLSKGGKLFCKKWNIRYPINPFENYIPGEEVCIKSSISYLEHPDKWNNIPCDTNQLIVRVNGKLVLMIDTSFPIEQIKKDLDVLPVEWGKKEPGKQRDSRSSDLTYKTDNLSIWKVYQMKEFEGLTLMEITKELYGISQHPDYDDDPQAWSCYNKIRRAYKKASKIVQSIESEMNNTSPKTPS